MKWFPNRTLVSTDKLSGTELHLVPDLDHTNIDENLRSTAFEWCGQYAT